MGLCCLTCEQSFRWLPPQDDPTGEGILPLALSPQPSAFHPYFTMDLPVYVLQVWMPTTLFFLVKTVIGLPTSRDRPADRPAAAAGLLWHLLGLLARVLSLPLGEAVRGAALSEAQVGCHCSSCLWTR